MNKNPNAVVAIILKNFDSSSINEILLNEVLCIKSYKRNSLGFPGGKIEPNESELEALIREVKEETNLIVINAIKIDHFPDDTHLVSLFFVSKWEGEISSSKEGIVCWSRFNDLCEQTISNFYNWNIIALDRFLPFIKDYNECK